MKSIAIIVQKLNGGGAERTASNLSIILSEYYKVHLLVFDGTNITYPYKGILHDLKLPPRKNKILNLLKRITIIKKIKKKYDISASISLMEGANLVNILSKSSNHETIITSIRNYMSLAQVRNKYFDKHLMQYIARKSNYVVALSKGVEEDLFSNYKIEKNKLKTIYNPVNVKSLNKFYSESFNENNIIATMGRLEKQKGQWHLIKAMKKVVYYFPNAKLVIYGEGTLKERLINLTEKLNLSQSIIFKGYIPYPHQHIAKSTIFVFPSLFEGLGNVLLEMLACGVPCIATDCLAGPREILDDNVIIKQNLKNFELAKYGILVSVPSGDLDILDSKLTKEEEQMADAIICLLKDKSLRENYRKKGLERAADFSYDNISKKWIELIENQESRNEIEKI